VGGIWRGDRFVDSVKDVGFCHDAELGGVNVLRICASVTFTGAHCCRKGHWALNGSPFMFF